MTKQEEVRNILTRYGDFMDGNCMSDDVLDLDGAILKLQELGVVIMVERELPELDTSSYVGIGGLNLVEYTQQKLLNLWKKLGCGFFEPLVEEEK